MRAARNQPEVEVMADKVGIKISVRGIMPAIMARRVSRLTLRSTGPTTKPMNRSMPVHRAPDMTWTKSSSQRLEPRMAASIAASGDGGGGDIAAAQRRHDAHGGRGIDGVGQAALPLSNGSDANGGYRRCQDPRTGSGNAA